jgi:hypothetical protein
MKCSRSSSFVTRFCHERSEKRHFKTECVLTTTIPTNMICSQSKDHCVCAVRFGRAFSGYRLLTLLLQMLQLQVSLHTLSHPTAHLSHTNPRFTQPLMLSLSLSFPLSLSCFLSLLSLSCSLTSSLRLSHTSTHTLTYSPLTYSPTLHTQSLSFARPLSFSLSFACIFFISDCICMCHFANP